MAPFLSFFGRERNERNKLNKMISKNCSYEKEQQKAGTRRGCSLSNLIWCTRLLLRILLFQPNIGDICPKGSVQDYIPSNFFFTMPMYIS